MTIFYNDGSGVRNVTELENKARPHMNLYHRACINSSSRLGGRSHNISQILSYIDKIRHIFENQTVISAAYLSVGVQGQKS